MDLYKSQLACEQLDSKMVQFLMHLKMVNCYQWLLTVVGYFHGRGGVVLALECSSNQQ